MIELTDQQKRFVWTYSLSTVVHAPDQWRDFRHHFPDCREYRFQGALGFGGKVWSTHRSIDVTCYPEDETPDRRARIDAANTALAALSSEPSLDRSTT